MCSTNGEPVTVLLDTNRKARKPHQCDECGRTIRPSEIYEEQRYKLEGRVYTHATCAHCLIPRAWLATNCEAWIYGGVHEDIAEHVTEYPSLAEPLKRLADGMACKWTLVDGALMPIPEQAPNISVQERH